LNLLIFLARIVSEALFDVPFSKALFWGILALTLYALFILVFNKKKIQSKPQGVIGEIFELPWETTVLLTLPSPYPVNFVSRLSGFLNDKTDAQYGYLARGSTPEGKLPVLFVGISGSRMFLEKFIKDIGDKTDINEPIEVIDMDAPNRNSYVANWCRTRTKPFFSKTSPQQGGAVDVATGRPRH